MAIDASMEPMLDVFIYEATTLLEQLDEILLNSEKSKHFSDDSINEIFRIMHTIKGSSAMMDYVGISSLAHAVEDVFFIIREAPDSAEAVSADLFDLVFQALDFLKAEMDSVQQTHEANMNPQDIIAQLRLLSSVLKGEAPPAPQPGSAPAQAEEAAQAPSSGEEYKVKVHFDDGCQMENIRSFMLISQIKEICDSVTSIPPNPESDASLCSDIIRDGITIIFTPSSSVSVEEIYGIIEGAVNIKSYEPIFDEPETPKVIAPAAAPVIDKAPAPAPSVTTAQVANPVQVKPEAPAAQPAPAAPKPTLGQGKQQSLISVNQSKLDQLMDLMGELVTTESMVVNNIDLKGLKLDNFTKSARELRKLTDELQDVVMSIRMVPLSGVFQKMQRIVRDMGKKLDKQVELVTIGGETEVDKTINESIGDPFMHMIRNSVDHGIEDAETRRLAGKPEVGTVTMEAKNVGGEIVITISDDGKGLDPEKLLAKARANGLLTKPESEYSDKEIYGLIMLAGFSTNQEVTEFSGRGVGMDVVRKNLEKLGGTISIDSEKGVGTTFTIKIPLTLAIVDGMELAVGPTIFTLPIMSIQQSFKISDDSQVLINTDGTEMIMLRGECFPLIRLHRIFNFETEITDLKEGIVILIESGRDVACIFADELLGEQQVVVKPFPTFLNKYNIKHMGLSGCTILGDGSISLILDANNLLTLHKM